MQSEKTLQAAADLLLFSSAADLMLLNMTFFPAVLEKPVRT